MAKKFSKEELSELLIRIRKQSDIDDAKAEIDDIADEFNLDLDDIEPIDKNSNKFDDELIDEYESNDNYDNDDDDY